MAVADCARSVHRFFTALLIVVLIGGCAGLIGQEPLRVSIAGIEPLAGEGLEMRFNMKLRIQNPNDTPLEYHGVFLQLNLNGKPFASGVSDESGVVPRFGETVLDVPLTVPVFTALRQAFAFAGSAAAGKIPYEMRGKLAGSLGGGTRFVDHGELSLPTEGMMMP
jgi:LEA14-like dessication related protein